jgi:hypothetical protein
MIRARILTPMRRLGPTLGITRNAKNAASKIIITLGRKSSI